MSRRTDDIFKDHRARVIALVVAAYVLALVLGAGFALLQTGRAGDELLITPQLATTRPPRATGEAASTEPGTPPGPAATGVLPTTVPPPGETPPSPPPGETLPPPPPGGTLPPPGTNPPPTTLPPPVATLVPSPTPRAGTPALLTPTPTAPATGTPTPTAKPGGTVVPPTATTGSTPYPPDASATALAMLLTGTAQAAALPTGLPSVTIVSQGFYISYTGDLVLMGEVRNDTTRLLGSIVIHFWVYDANQYVLGDGDLVSDLYVLPSGETSSFGTGMRVDNPDLVARVAFRVVDAPDGDGAPVEGVEVHNQQVGHDAGELIITGTVENTSAVPYSWLVIYAIVRDPSTHEPVRWAIMLAPIELLVPDDIAAFELRADDVSSLDTNDIRFYIAAD
jgi:hypothetical protein